MTEKSVLICEYCGKQIDQDDHFVFESHRDGCYVNHEGYYHQECFINSMIKDLEDLGFEILRPRSEINRNVSKNDYFQLPLLSTPPLPLDQETFKDVLSVLVGNTNQNKNINPTQLLADVSKKLSEEDMKKVQELKKRAMDKVVKSQVQNGKEKSKAKSIGTGKKK